MPLPAARVTVLMPFRDDGPALAGLLPRLAAALNGCGPAGLVIVDDGSETDLPDDWTLLAHSVQFVRILRLRRNLGHQRAIAVGLSYIDEHVDSDAVLIMDSDGEDRPEDVPALLTRFEQDGGKRIVFAERGRRAEGVVFRIFYAAYLLLHRALTGFGVRIGNFSVVPRECVSSLVVVSELWIHYAASVVRSRQPYCTVPTVRGRRLHGLSRMGFVSLVVHGLSAIAVYSDLIFTRLIMASSVLAVLCLAALMSVIAVRLLTSLAIPGWATYSAGLLVVILLQVVMFAISLTFVVLGARQHATIVPRRDYRIYVRDVIEVPMIAVASG